VGIERVEPQVRCYHRAFRQTQKFEDERVKRENTACTGKKGYKESLTQGKAGKLASPLAKRNRTQQHAPLLFGDQEGEADHKNLRREQGKVISRAAFPMQGESSTKPKEKN